MGFLCAAALKDGCLPPREVSSGRRSRGAGAAIAGLFSMEGPTPCWKDPFLALTAHQQNSVAPLVVAAVLRRARTNGDLALIRETLQVALDYDLVNGPAPVQAASLVRRSQALDRELSKRAQRPA